MELRDYIEAGEKKIGGRVALANYLEQNPDVISAAKTKKRGLPSFACVALAKLIGVPEIEVIAASELVTEKKPERRAIWAPFIQGAARHAMAVTLVVGVTSFVTPPPVQAAQNFNDAVLTFCIM